MKIKEVIRVLEEVAPLELQEGYDNAGLIVGDDSWDVNGVLLCLDSTEEIVQEAISKGCNLIVAHHPIVFSGIKKLNGKHYIERTVISAVKNDIAIYACHTNLDKVFADGVNEKFAEKLGLQNTRILKPENGLLNQLSFYVPEANKKEVLEKMYDAGAGHIGNYSHCSFSFTGQGTFKPEVGAKPTIGEEGIVHHGKEEKIELLVENSKLSRVLGAMKKAHPYEEVAHFVLPIKNKHPRVGFGLLGELAKPMNPKEFLKFVKESLGIEGIRYTDCSKTISKVAVCGGSGSFLFSEVKRAGADAYITSDVKYHQFFDPENEFLLADIGHYESEIYTLEIFHKLITEKFPTFAVLFTDRNTNPVKYF